MTTYTKTSLKNVKKGELVEMFLNLQSQSWGWDGSDYNDVIVFAMNVHNFVYRTKYDDPGIVSSFDFDAIIKEMEKDEKELKEGSVPKEILFAERSNHRSEMVKITEGRLLFEKRNNELKKKVKDLNELLIINEEGFENVLKVRTNIAKGEIDDLKAEVAKYHAVQSLLLCEGACPNSDGFEAKIVEMKKDIVNLKDEIETMEYTIENEMYDQDAFDILEDENAQLIKDNKKLTKDAKAWAIVRKHLAKDIEEYKKLAEGLNDIVSHTMLTDDD